MKIVAANKDHLSGHPLDLSVFDNPPAGYWPVYSWWWNGTITREAVQIQIDRMADKGIKGFYIVATPADFRPNQRPTPLEPDYGTDDYFQLYRFAVDYAAQRGMSVWFYDEPGFPSGSAGGQVVLKNPAVEKKGLCRSERLLRAGEPYQVPDDVIGAFILDTWPVRGSFVAGEAVLLAEYRVAAEKPYPIPVPDLLDERATDILLDILFNAYDKQIGRHFGDAVRIVFIDEPAAPRHPWTPGFDKLFLERFGYEIGDFLPALLNPYLQGAKGRQARIDYYELNSELFYRRYFARLQTWCREHHLLLGGHLGGEDDTCGGVEHGYLHLLRMLRAMDVPGVDAIWRQIFPGRKQSVQSNLGRIETAQNRFFPRYASSAANQTGSSLAMTESGAVYGAGLTFSQLRYVITFQLVRGINMINCMGLYFSGQDHLAASCRPNYTYEPPHARDLAAFNAYVARLSYLMTAGRIDVAAALYMPMRDIWVNDSLSARTVDCYEEIACSLERGQCYFDIVDDDVLESADHLDAGFIDIGLASYRILIIPCCRFIPDTSRNQISRFIRGGGKVIAISDPVMPDLENARMISLSQVPEHVRPIVAVDPDCPGLRAIRRILPDGGSLYCLTNEDFRTISCTVAFDETPPVYEADSKNGRLFVPEHQTAGRQTKIRIELASGEEKVYLFGQDQPAVSESPPAESGNWICLEEIWQFSFRRIRRLVIGEHRLESLDIREPAQTVPAGDWRRAAGADFSGDALYQAFFTKPAATGTILLDLGDVRYTCEVWLNGRNLGVRCLAPYAYVLNPDWLAADNNLEIRVSNTAANEFAAKDDWLTEKYTIKKLGSYHILNTCFERDSLPSGLYGPVRICAADGDAGQNRKDRR